MRTTIEALILAAIMATATPVHSAENSNSLVGVFVEVPASSKWAGAQVTFTGLMSARPSVVWPDGSDERLSKVFENENLFVLQFVGSIGSTDTVYIEKKNKRFLVVSVGVFTIVANNKAATVGLYRGSIK